MPHSYTHIESSHHQMRLLTLRFSLQAIQHSAVQLEVNRPQNWSALFRLVGALCIAALWRVKSLLRHRSDRPKRRLTTDQMAFVAGRHVALA